MKHLVIFNLLLVAGFMMLASSIFISCSTRETEENWISLFNGKNLEGWEIKIAGYKLGENYANTFRVEDGILMVCYDQYNQFDNRFGHIFYHQPFSHYKLRLEYRFYGEQAPGGGSWAKRNNGIMFHSQSAASMDFDQYFPVSVEAQLLGGLGEGHRPTGNICTPGTNVEVDGVRIYDHCIEADSPTFHGDQWIHFELVVYGDSLVHHIVEGDTVITYGNIRFEESGMPLKNGHIALQAESHPTAFRNIKLLEISSE